jgi:hypothetical protein
MWQPGLDPIHPQKNLPSLFNERSHSILHSHFRLNQKIASGIGMDRKQEVRILCGLI